MNRFLTSYKPFATLTMFLLSTFAAFTTQATIVQFETNFGNFTVNLYDQDTPETVANFLQYLDDGNGNNAYTNVIIHRSVDNFIIQGGGFTYNGGTSLNEQNLPLDTISANPAVTNEPTFSNVRGSIAMAKLGGNPNSATNQWYFNLANNATNLDNQNGGYTVFGEVTAEGLEILDQISLVDQFDKSGAFTSIPLANYDGSSVPDNSNLIIITSIQITDPTVDTAADLTPALSTAPAVTPPSEQPESSGGGGGALAGFILLALLLVTRKRAG